MSETALNIIMFICIYPVLPVMYAVFKNETKPKKSIVIGVTLPAAALAAEDVKKICRRYKREMAAVLFVMTILLTGVFFVKYSSVAMTYFMVWLEISVLVPFAIYASSNRKLRRLKAERGWQIVRAGKNTTDALPADMPLKRVGIWWFAPPLIMCLVPVVCTAAGSRDAGFWGEMAAYLINAALVFLFYFLYRVIYRRRMGAEVGDTAVNAALIRVRRHSWSAAWLWVSWLTGLFSLCLWLLIYKPLPLIFISLAYSAIIIFIMIRAEFRVRALQQKIIAEGGVSFITDEDEYWINGMFYYNPGDRHVMIEKRIGTGMTVNLASARGKTVIALCVLCLLALPLTGAWMMEEEFTQIVIVTDASGISASHLSTEFDVAFDEIDSAELINALPDATKVNGTAFGTLLKGKFMVPDLGTCEICLNPEVPPFILIKAGSGTYIIGSEDASSTLRIYADIMAAL